MVNVLAELWARPTLIQPQMHKQICEIVYSHMNGDAHSPGGRVDQFSADIVSLADGVHHDKENDTYCGYRNGVFAQDVPAGISISDGIATVFFHGVIAKRVSGVRGSSGVTDATDLEEAARFALTSDEVAGVLLDIDSPGGAVTGTPEVAEMIKTLGKPVVAYTDSMMASAAYWIGSQASSVMASPSAQVGSIGVYMAWLDTTRAFEIQGYKTELIKHGKFKAMGVDGISLTDDQRTMLQEGVDDVYDWFVGAVNAARSGIPASAMEGQVFYAEDAAGQNLIDAVGTRDEAIAELRDLIEQAKETTGMTAKDARDGLAQKTAELDALKADVAIKETEATEATAALKSDHAAALAAKDNALAEKDAQVTELTGQIDVLKTGTAGLTTQVDALTVAKDAAETRAVSAEAKLTNPAFEAAAKTQAEKLAESAIDAEADAAEAQAEAADTAKTAGTWAEYLAIEDPAKKTEYWTEHKAELRAAQKSAANEKE